MYQIYSGVLMVVVFAIAAHHYREDFKMLVKQQVSGWTLCSVVGILLVGIGGIITIIVNAHAFSMDILMSHCFKIGLIIVALGGATMIYDNVILKQTHRRGRWIAYLGILVAILGAVLKP